MTFIEKLDQAIEDIELYFSYEMMEHYAKAYKSVVTEGMLDHGELQPIYDQYIRPALAGRSGPREIPEFITDVAAASTYENRLRSEASIMINVRRARASIVNFVNEYLARKGIPENKRAEVIELVQNDVNGLNDDDLVREAANKLRLMIGDPARAAVGR